MTNQAQISKCRNDSLNLTKKCGGFFYRLLDRTVSMQKAISVGMISKIRFVLGLPTHISLTFPNCTKHLVSLFFNQADHIFWLGF
jgi:hypothetical protein